MKKIYALLLAAALWSCAKNESPFPAAQAPVRDALLTVRIAGAETTKSTATNWEDAKVSSATVYVFNSDGTLDNSATSTTNTVTVRCSQGVGKKVRVVVGKSISSAIGSVSDLGAANTSLPENTAGHFVMTGGEDNVEIQATATAPIEIEVVRYASKVSLAKIPNSLTETTWKDLEFRVKGIYLINAPGGAFPLFADSYTPSLWYNQMGHEAGAADNWLYDSMNTVIANGASLSQSHTFYCMPNPTAADANGGSFTPRKTRLVVEVQIGTRTFYYPITLGTLERNKHYSIANLNLTRLGSSHPDYPVSSAQAQFDIQVKDWTTVNMNTQTI